MTEFNSPEEGAILITADDRALRQGLVTEAELTGRIIPITTSGRINSAEEVYRRANDAGRATRAAA